MTPPLPPQPVYIFHHTFFGFIKDSHDAALVIAGCVAGDLQPFNTAPMNSTSIQITSGTVLVFQENSGTSMVRWRDGKRWSPSRPQGQFLLYRKLTTNPNMHHEVELSTRFVNMSLRGSCRFIPNGLAKRTIGLVGSDGNRYSHQLFLPARCRKIFEDKRDDVMRQSRQVLFMPSQLQQFFKYRDVDEAERYSPPPNSRKRSASSSSERIVSPQRHGSGGLCAQTSLGTYSPPLPARAPTPQHCSTVAFRHPTHRYRPYLRHPSSPPLPPLPVLAQQQPSPSTTSSTVSLLPPFQATDERAYFRGENAFHPMFQVSDMGGCHQKATGGNFGHSHNSDVRASCPCGGLGIRKAHNYFWNDPFWFDRPIQLAPLKKV
ncbi:Gti1/Pac2 family-domain-containing protein [Obelidium mucronatum]|nr:Gti1/Pac2 family-domain-containing protein [Obelidium mucronatum]